MKLVEIATESHSTGAVQINHEYFYVPDLQADVDGNIQRIIGFAEIVDGRAQKRFYALSNEANDIKVRVIGIGHPDSADSNVFKVRVLNNPDEMLRRYSPIHERFIETSSGKVIEYALKDVPELTNFERITDEEFITRYNRPRLERDRGLVGYLLNVGQLKEANDDGQKSVVGMAQAAPTIGAVGSLGDDGSTKLSRAIGIYRANQGKARKDVVKIMQVQLGMTKAGASSYFTKAKHAVEDNAK